MKAALVVAELFIGAVVALTVVEEWPAPRAVPCYDFLDASANVVVLFNKCTGDVELRILKGAGLPLKKESQEPKTES